MKRLIFRLIFDIYKTRNLLFSIPNIVGPSRPPPPPSPLLKGRKGGRGRTFQKLSHFGRGSEIFLLVRGDNPEKGGVNVEKGGGGVATFLLLYRSITFTVCEGKIRFPLLLFGSSVFRVSHTRLPSNSIICTFLIYSGGLQKMLTALSNLLWNTQKSKWTVFLSLPGKIYLRQWCNT